jgi:RnfABCDGE-type electron transport complex G subunit
VKSAKAYPVVFVVVMCCLCASVLTFAHRVWRDRIAANESFAKIEAIVTALGLAPDGADRRLVIDTYTNVVTKKDHGEMKVYERWSDGELVGYAFEVEGKGKYGPIKGILAIDAVKKQIQALRIYEHNETPGLGGQIASQQWLSQFRGVPLKTDGRQGVVVSSTETGPNVIQSITAASATSDSVARIVNRGIAQFLAGGVRLVPLDLELGREAVTQATPGYDQAKPKPANLREEEKVERPEFYVRPPVSNLALGKPVTSSIEHEPIIGELSMITDGVKTSEMFDYVELQSGPQWVQIDLGRKHVIYAVVIWHFYKNPVIYKDVIVQVADDVGLGRGKDKSYRSRWWAEIVDARGKRCEGTNARFVRVYTNGGMADEPTRFVEIAVCGK